MPDYEGGQTKVIHERRQTALPGISKETRQVNHSFAVWYNSQMTLKPQCQVTQGNHHAAEQPRKPLLMKHRQHNLAEQCWETAGLGTTKWYWKTQKILMIWNNFILLSYRQIRELAGQLAKKEWCQWNATCRVSKAPVLGGELQQAKPGANSKKTWINREAEQKYWGHNCLPWLPIFCKYHYLQSHLSFADQ